MSEKKVGRTILRSDVLFLSLIFLLIPAFFLKLFHSLPLTESFLWYVCVFVSFYVPGNLLLRWLDLNNDEYLITVFHSIALGVALIPLVYIIIRRISHPDLIVPLVIGIFFLWLLLSIRDLKLRKLAIFASYSDIASLLSLIFVVLVFLHLSYFTDIVFLENAFKIRTSPLSETIFHLGIINALKDTFPPTFIYSSGFLHSSYHLNMHLEIEMFHRLSSLDTVKLTFFYFPLLYLYLLVFIPYYFIRRYWKKRFIGVLIGILFFGSDLSFIPGLLFPYPEGYPWIDIFGRFIRALLNLNGFLPSLIVMLLSMVYLKEFQKEARTAHLFIFSLLAYSAYGFKTSLGLQMLGAVFVTGVLLLTDTHERKKAVLLCVASVLTAAAIVVDLAIFREGFGRTVSFEFLNFFHRSLRSINLHDISWWLYFVLFPLYIIGTFGVKSLGFHAFNALFRKGSRDTALLFLAIFVPSGFFLSEFISVHPRTDNMDDAQWFATQSLSGACLLLSYFFLRLKDYRRRFWGVVVFVILLSIPGTVQFVSLRSIHDYNYVDSRAMDIVRYLEATPPDSVILHPINYVEPSLASNFAGRPTVLSWFRSFTGINIGEREVAKRYWDIISFFDRQNKIDRSSLLTKYKVNYVYAPFYYEDFLDRESILSKVFKNSGYVLYKVNK